MGSCHHGYPAPIRQHGGTAVLVFFGAVGLALSGRRPTEVPVTDLQPPAEPEVVVGPGDRPRSGPLPSLSGLSRMIATISLSPRSTRPSPWWSRNPDAGTGLPGGAPGGHGMAQAPPSHGFAPAP